MADTSNLSQFLEDVADAIREKREVDYKIKPENFDEEIKSITTGTGGDTSDATATINDVLSPKTFYAGNKKQIGAIDTVYKEVSNSVNNTKITPLSDICDYRSDIGYYLRMNTSDNTVEIYSIKTNELIKTLNTNKELSTVSDKNLYLKNAIFSREPVEGNTYNIYINGFVLTSGRDQLYVGLIAVRFNLDDILEDTIYFKRYDTNGSRLGGREYVTSVALTESNNYVFSGIQAESGYYEASPGYATLYYVDNTNNVITKKCNVRIATGQYGTVAKCTDDMRFIVMNNASYNTIISVSENYGSMTVLSNYTTSESNPRCILTPNGVIYNKQLRTVDGVVYTYDNLPFLYNDIVLSLGKYLFKFNNNMSVDIYVYNDVTYEITALKTLNLNGTITRNYYGNTACFTLSAFPIFQYNNIIYLTSSGTIYKCEPSDVNKVLDKIIISGNTMVNVSDITTTSDKVLEGNVFGNNKGSSIGTMPNNGTLIYEPSTEEQTIPAGYTSGGTISAVTSDIDPDIIPEHIKSGVNILGVEGTLTPGAGDATSDGNLQAKYLLEGYSMVVDGKLVEGTMPNNGTQTISYGSEDTEIPVGYYEKLTISAVDSSELTNYDECLDSLNELLGVPTNYQQLEYIEGTGSQYIDTGLAFDIAGCQAEINFQYTSNASNQFFCGTNMDFEGGIYESKFYTDSGFTYSQSSNLTARTVATGTNTGNNSKTIYLFARNWNSEKCISKMKLYSAKFYKNNILVRDFVPMLDNNAGSVGLYDKVNKQMYLNIGTGNFIGGGIVK